MTDRFRPPDAIRAATFGLVRRSFVVVGVTGWLVFWVIVVRLHYRLGHLLSAGVTTALFVLPAGLGLAYYLRASVPASQSGN